MMMATLLAAAHLVTLDPGHFHAALVQNRSYPDVAPEVRVFAPDGAELDAHLKLIGNFNARVKDPTAWREVVVRGPDYLERFVRAAKSGELGATPIVILAGKNDRKGEYALAAVEAGCNVLSDKPMAITPEVFEQTERAARLAERKGLFFADIMTERNEITTILQRALAQDRELYGEQETGTPEDPAVTKISVHHFCKLVNGAPLKRPEWYYDTGVQGEGLTDVTTHLVDLVQWEVFPGVRLSKDDVKVLSARTWPTRITPEQFKMSTGGTWAETKAVNANGEFTWQLKGVNCKVSVVWNFMAPAGTGDTHDSLLRGTKAEVVIRQGAKEGYKPVLYVRSRGDAAATEKSLKAALAKIAKDWPGVEAVTTGEAGVWRVAYPKKYDIGHEAHFSQVVRMYLDWMKAGREDPIYVDNMLVKYHTIVEAWKKAHAVPVLLAGDASELVPLPRPAEFRSDVDAPVAFDAATTVVLDCPVAEGVTWLARHFADWYGALAPKVVAGTSGLALPEGDEAYAVRAGATGVVVRARTLAGVRWAAYTLRQLAIAKRGTFKTEGRILPTCEIADKPLLPFRGLHLCCLPEVRGTQIERAIRLAALLKFNYVVLEPWGMYRSARHPWWGWPDGKLTKAEVKRLVALGRNLGVTLVPQINVFGHASLAHSISLKHAVLDFRPEYEPLFEPGGWNWCLSNPETQRVLRELIDEMHEDFGRPPYFHLGCDEAQPATCPECRKGSYAERVVAHIAGMSEYVRTLGARPMVWHDMFMATGLPGREHTVASGTPELEKLVERLPKDIVICDWQYSNYQGKDRDLNSFPSVDFFADRGFAVVAAPWENPDTEAFHAAHVARRGGLGLLQTTWHHLRGAAGRNMFVAGAAAAWGTPAVKPLPQFDTTFATALRLVGHDMRVAHPEDTGTYDLQLPPAWWPDN